MDKGAKDCVVEIPPNLLRRIVFLAIVNEKEVEQIILSLIEEGLGDMENKFYTHLSRLKGREMYPFDFFLELEETRRYVTFETGFDWMLRDVVLFLVRERRIQQLANGMIVVL